MSLRDDLKAYLDGELAPERMAEMREAIDRDPALAQEAEELGRISQTLRAAAAQPASLGLEATLRALEKAERRERKPWWPWLLPVAGMTAFLAFAVAPTMQQAKMAAKAPSSVAFHRDAEAGAAMSAPALEAMKDGDVATERYANPSAKMRNGNPAEARRSQAASSDLEVYDVKRIRGKRFDEGLRASPSSQPAKAVQNPKALSPSSSMQNARTGDLKGQELPRVSDFGDVRNIVVEPKEKKDGKAQESSIVDIRFAEAKAPVETIVIEVDSLAEANDAARELMARMGAEEAPSLARKSERDAVTANFDAATSQNLAKAERRVILEVNEDELAETKKRVSEAVKESQVRRESQQNRLRSMPGSPGGPGGVGGFGGGGLNQSQQADTNQGSRQQGPPGPSQLRTGGGQQVAPGGQGAMQGYQGRQAAPRGNAQSATPDGKKLADSQKSKQATAKLRKRIEVIFRIKPKPAGKLEE